MDKVMIVAAAIVALIFVFVAALTYAVHYDGSPGLSNIVPPSAYPPPSALLSSGSNVFS